MSKVCCEGRIAHYCEVMGVGNFGEAEIDEAAFSTIHKMVISQFPGRSTDENYAHAVARYFSKKQRASLPKVKEGGKLRRSSRPLSRSGNRQSPPSKSSRSFELLG